jgi:hypothetical protein
MSTLLKRTRTWKQKYNPARVKETLDVMHKDMTTRYEAAMAALFQMEEETRTVLNASGVHTIMYVPYYNYARELFRMTHGRSISGASCAVRARVLLDKWSACGLNPDVLAKIRTGVFNISDVPAPAE